MAELNVPINVLAKVQKLLSLADGAKAVGSTAEAENAASKASRLLMEYNISEEEARQFGQTKKAVKEESIDHTKKNGPKEGDWVRHLYSGIAKHNLCQVIIQKGHGKYKIPDTLILIGTDTNRELVNYFAEYLVPQIRQLARKSWSEYMGKEKRLSYIRAFLLGCAHGIAHKLAEQQEQMAAQNPKITDLVHVTGKEIQTYIDAIYGVLRSSEEYFGD